MVSPELMINELNGVIFSSDYQCGDDYSQIKARAEKVLGRYLKNPKYRHLYFFDKIGKKVHFASERLLPQQWKDRPRVMMLFSNPLPESLQKGMFHSYRLPNPFWSLLEESGWFDLPPNNITADGLRDRFLKSEFNGAFNLIFHCYYPFPTRRPEDIRLIFGGFFRRVIEPRSRKEFEATVVKNGVQAVLCFNGPVGGRLTGADPHGYTKDLDNGMLWKKEARVSPRGKISLYLIYPTGWWGRSRKKDLVQRKLAAIRDDILEADPSSDAASGDVSNP